MQPQTQDSAADALAVAVAEQVRALGLPFGRGQPVQLVGPWGLRSWTVLERMQFARWIQTHPDMAGMAAWVTAHSLCDWRGELLFEDCDPKTVGLIFTPGFLALVLDRAFALNKIGRDPATGPTSTGAGPEAEGDPAGNRG